jgi:hypothetical protein
MSVKLMSSARAARSPRSARSPIIIDESKGLVFRNETALFNHFSAQIDLLEREFAQLRERFPNDISDQDFSDYEDVLQMVVEDPDEVWKFATSIHGYDVYAYLGLYEVNGQETYYIALCYRTGETPSFIFLHFPTHEFKLADQFRRGELIFDRISQEVGQGAIEGDALTEGDAAAVGLYQAMMKIRSDSETEVPESRFQDFKHLRELTIDDPDEIWKSTDSKGQNWVSFIKDFGDEDQDSYKGHPVTYVVVTLEDSNSDSHALMFSFPTTDINLVDRYRHGENLQAETVKQDPSH